MKEDSYCCCQGRDHERSLHRDTCAALSPSLKTAGMITRTTECKGQLPKRSIRGYKRDRDVVSILGKMAGNQQLPAASPGVMHHNGVEPVRQRQHS